MRRESKVRDFRCIRLAGLDVDIRDCNAARLANASWHGWLRPGAPLQIVNKCWIFLGTALLCENLRNPGKHGTQTFQNIREFSTKYHQIRCAKSDEVV